MKFSIDFDDVGMRRYLGQLSDQAHFAMAVALTKTASNAKAMIVNKMPQVFDRPTPYTLGSIYIKPATKANLVAIIDVKDAAQKYLGPEVYSGTRTQKRGEQALERFKNTLGLPSRVYAVPGAGAILDRYGNLKGGQMMQILSVLRAAPDPYQNITARSRRRNKKPRAYFVGRIHGTLGVWERRGIGHVVPILIFTGQPSYKKRLPFFEIARAVFDAEIKQQFNLAFAAAIETIKVR